MQCLALSIPELAALSYYILIQELKGLQPYFSLLFALTDTWEAIHHFQFKSFQLCAAGARMGKIGK